MTISLPCLCSLKVTWDWYLSPNGSWKMTWARSCLEAGSWGRKFWSESHNMVGEKPLGWSCVAHNYTHSCDKTPSTRSQLRQRGKISRRSRLILLVAEQRHSGSVNGCTQSLIACPSWCCFYRQPKLTLILSPVQILGTLWQGNLCQKSE